MGRAQEQAQKAFADQFKVEDGRVLYRRSHKEAPIAVSEAERDAFIAGFVTAYRRMFIGLVGGLIGFAVLLTTLEVALGLEAQPAWCFAVVVVVIGPFLLVWQRVWNAPARALRDRTPVGGRPTRDEARRVALRQISWGQLGGALLVPPIAMLLLNQDRDLLHGWNRLWLAAAVAWLALIAVQAYRKWQADRD